MTKKEYDEKQGLVRRFNEAYESGEPVATDYEYDMLMLSLKEAEKEHPEWRDASSPTQTVGAPVKRTSGQTVAHDVPMLSIEDVFTKEEVAGWVEEVKSAHADALFVVEHKIDGLSMSIRYENGEMVLAETRGDGYVGEDVTMNARVIPDVTEKLPMDPGSLEIRGEVYMKNADFLKVNAEQELLGKKVFANPRNCAAGTLRQLDPSVTEKRGLSMFIFNIQRAEDPSLTESHSAALSFLKERLGIVTVPGTLCSTADEVLAAIDRIGEMRGELEYDIDGAVVKIDQIRYREDFPAGSKYSAGHIAYKYPPEEKETVIRDIEISIGMTGRVNPTAVFDPVRLCGTTVSRATLHNQDFIDKLHIGIGDTVVVYKSGEIIPKIRCSVPEKRPQGTSDFRLPDRCPVCGSPIVRDGDAADLRCTGASCPAQTKRLLINFAGRGAMDIKGLGEEIISQLADEGYLKDVADIYHLREHRDELVESGITGREKNTDKLLTAIERSKQNEPSRLLAGLAIPNVGAQSAKTLLSHFGSVENLMNADIDALTGVRDIGAVTAGNIRAWFENEGNAGLIRRLREAGLKMDEKKTEVTDELAGRTYVITGDLRHFANREAMAEFIRERGGKVSGSVSGKTTALISNDPGSMSGKSKKAQSLGIPVITEEEFLENPGAAGIGR